VTVREIMSELQLKGDEKIKKILLKHGVKEPLFGVKVAYLKVIQKRVKMDYGLAKGLFDTGNADAMYLAGLIADDKKMTKSDLEHWVTHAVSNNICEYTVPWVAAGSAHGWELALVWIEDREEHIAAAGWSTLGGLVSIVPDDQLDIPALKILLDKVTKTIHGAGNRVRYTMNGFIIGVGIYVPTLTSAALEAAQKIGNVIVNMDGTACKLPDVAAYILKAKTRGSIGKKKKTVKC
jgi:3-methyladenine DNA glycosylase AlkD